MDRHTAIVLKPLALVFALALAGCNSSSSDDNGDDNGGDDTADNGGDDGNGSEEPPTTGVDLSDADNILLYAAESLDSNPPTPFLAALAPTDPEDELQLTPRPQDNARARTDEAIYRNTEGENQADPHQLPQGLVMGDWDDGALNNIHTPRAIYNSQDGELFVVNTDGGAPEASRFSAESDAEVVCAAAVFADYQTLDNSIVAYQVAGSDGRCDQTEWRMVMLGMDTSEDPIVLRDEVTYADDFRPPSGSAPEGFSEHWVAPVRDADGALTGVMSADRETDNTLVYHRTDGTEKQLGFVGDFFRPLGHAGSTHRMVLQLGGNLKAFDRDDEVLESLSDSTNPSVAAQVEDSLTGPESAVRVGDILYLVDIIDGDDDNGQVLAVNPDASGEDQVQMLADDWGTGCALGTVTTGSDSSVDYLAWAYRDDCSDGDTGTIRHLVLDGSTQSHELHTVNYDFPMPVQSPTAPVANGNTPLLFYTRGTRSWAGAVDITGTTGGNNLQYELDGADFVGVTWATDQPVSGPQAEFLFYMEDDADSVSILKAREATDITGGTAVTFDNPPNRGFVNRTVGNVYVAGYGPKTLLGVRPSFIPPDLQNNNLRGTIWYADARDPASMAEVRQGLGYTARPVWPF